MGPLSIGMLGMAALFALIILKIPIGVAMIIVGITGFALQTSWWTAASLLANEPSGLFSSLDMATLPLFLLMGTFANAAGFSADIYAAAAAFLGHRRGGLAYATIGGCAAFGAVCGSSTATAATFTTIALPQMLSRGYAASFATGSVAAGGTLKALIPPSLIMILYCIIAKTFIYDLFAAAILPALIVIALNLATVNIAVRLSPGIAPVSEPIGWPERLAALKQALPALVLMITVFGGLYSGVFTVNEAASVAAVLALVFALVRGRLDVTHLIGGLLESARVTAMLYTVLMGASIFTYFMTLGRVPETLVQFVGTLNWSPVAIVSLILVSYLVLGAVFDELSTMLITLPLVLPIIVALGYDPVWWGIINVVVIELGLIIPPIGIIVFIIHGMRRDISLRTIYKGVTPFIIADLVLLALLTLFPILTLLIPQALNR